MGQKNQEERLITSGLLKNAGQREGKIIVFEGVEGCGKTTQLRRLGEWLENPGVIKGLPSAAEPSPVVVTREPGGTKLGLGLRRLLLEVSSGVSLHDRSELLLYAADRAQHVEELLLPSLSAGKIVLCDRYTDSTIAYQGYGRGINLKLISLINQIATNGLESDLTFWLDIDVEIGLARKRNQGEITRMEEADLAFHQRVQQGFTELAKAHPERTIRIDASLSEEAIAQQIQGIMSDRLAKWYGIQLND